MTGGDTIRVFVALDIPDEIRENIRHEQAALKRELPRARWTRPEGQHLTLKFLGEVPASSIDPLSEAIERRAPELSRVRVALGGSGFFPSPRRPRVAWVGGRAEGGAEAAAAVDRAIAPLGFPRERRPWSLHLTQARLDRPWPRASVERFLDWGRALDLPAFTCAELVLFRSELAPGGAVYTALKRVALA
jgi:2'-5' RNA ligase